MKKIVTVSAVDARVLSTDTLKVRERINVTEIDIKRIAVDQSKAELERCCGNCCWFYAEDTYGYGCCPFQFGEVGRCEDKCKHNEEFVSKEQMRHHRAVLLQYRRWNNSPGNINIYRPSLKDIDNAMKFASKYMKVFSNL